MAALGLACGVLILLVLRLLGVEPAIVPVATVLIAGPVMGNLVGRQLITVRCSRPACANEIAADAHACPHCGAALVGDLGAAQDHAAALEAYRERNELPIAAVRPD